MSFQPLSILLKSLLLWSFLIGVLKKLCKILRYCSRLGRWKVMPSMWISSHIRFQLLQNQVRNRYFQIQFILWNSCSWIPLRRSLSLSLSLSCPVINLRWSGCLPTLGSPGTWMSMSDGPQFSFCSKLQSQRTHQCFGVIWLDLKWRMVLNFK